LGASTMMNKKTVLQIILTFAYRNWAYYY